MKKLIIAIILILLLAVAALFIAGNFAQSIINSSKPQIEEEASKALGTKVTLGDIEIGFWPNVTLQTKNIAIGSDAQAPKLGLFRASIAVAPLFSGTIAIKEIIITAPSISLKNTPAGIIPVGLPINQQSTQRETKPTSPSEKSVSGEKQQELPVSVNLEKFELKDAQITYQDETNGQRFEIKQLSLATDLSFAKNILTIRDLNGGLTINGSPISYGLKGKFSPTAIDLERCSFQAFGGTGTITASGQIGKQIISTVSLKGFDSSSALAVVKPDLAQRISGTLSELTAKTSTLFTSSGVVTTGDGNISLTNGGIKGVNLVAPLIKAVLKSTPNDQQPLALSPEEQQALDSPNTTFDSIETKFNLTKSGVVVNQLSVLSALFELSGEGTIAHTGELDMRSALILSQRLSTALVAKNKDLSNVAREDKRIEAPVTITGTTQKPLVTPDISKLLQNALAGKLGKKADEALQKAFGNKGISLKGLGF